MKKLLSLLFFFSLFACSLNQSAEQAVPTNETLQSLFDITYGNGSAYPKQKTWVTFTAPANDVPTGVELITDQSFSPVIRTHTISPDIVLCHALVENQSAKAVMTEGIVMGNHDLETFKINQSIESYGVTSPQLVVVKNNLPINHNPTGGQGYLIEDNLARRVYYYSSRIPGTMFVVDYFFYIWNDQDFATWEMNLTISDRSVQTMDEVINGVHAWHSQPWDIKANGMLGAGYPVYIPEFEVYASQLMFQGSYGDGMCFSYYGSMYFPPDPGSPEWRTTNLTAELNGVSYAVAHNWDHSWGPYKRTPKPDTAPGITPIQYFEALESSYKGALRPPTNAFPLICNPRPADAGFQNDFGLSKGTRAVTELNPFSIYEYRVAALGEARRPCNFRNLDASVVIAALESPRLNYWSGRPHHSLTESPNQLGKPHPTPPYTDYGWRPKDDEHWSSLNLAAAYALTGSWQLRVSILNEIELLLGQLTLDPARSTTGMSAPRAVGRTMQSLSWFVWATGSTRAFQRITDRYYASIHNKWLGWNVEGPLKVLGTQHDPRVLGGRYPGAKIWENSLGVHGLYAAYVLTGNPDILSVTKKVAFSIVNYGFFQQDNVWHVCNVIRYYPGGYPPPPEMYYLGSLELETGGFDTDWIVSSLYIARELWTEGDDPAILERCNMLIANFDGRPTYTSAEWKLFK